MHLLGPARSILFRTSCIFDPERRFTLQTHGPADARETGADIDELSTACSRADETADLYGAQATAQTTRPRPPPARETVVIEYGKDIGLPNTWSVTSATAVGEKPVVTNWTI